MQQIGVIGGGLAGLALSIELAEAGLSVALFEKHQYPFHRLCGEYISMESLPYLQKLGIEPFEHGAVRIEELFLSAPSGRFLTQKLPLGGFGISRFLLDSLMVKRAADLGVMIFQKTQVLDVKVHNAKCADIHTHNQGIVRVEQIVGAFGKRSNLDARLGRAFYKKSTPYMAVKHHVKLSGQSDKQIALHNFKDGYCGFSRVEDETFCLCYLTTRQNQKAYKSIRQMESELLSKNPFLEKIFSEAEFVWDKPIIINEVSFEKKTLYEAGLLCCGDAVGMITPLCGNGMSMALHSATILACMLKTHFLSPQQKEFPYGAYQKKWDEQFAMRLRVGRMIQRFFGDERLSDYLVRFFAKNPTLGKALIRLTHGKPF